MDMINKANLFVCLFVILGKAALSIVSVIGCLPVSTMSGPTSTIGKLCPIILLVIILYGFKKLFVLFIYFRIKYKTNLSKYIY